ETAMHCRNGWLDTENCVKIQRFAILSKSTIGSPSLLFWQPPPKPCHNVLPSAGPNTLAPVDLLKTAKAVFTHWTYWVVPIAPLVRGGALGTVTPLKRLPTPSKLRPAVVPPRGRGPNVRCSGGSRSLCSAGDGAVEWRQRNGALCSRRSLKSGGISFISRRGRGVLSKWSRAITSGFTRTWTFFVFSPSAGCAARTGSPQMRPAAIAAADTATPTNLRTIPFPPSNGLVAALSP